MQEEEEEEEEEAGVVGGGSLTGLTIHLKRNDLLPGGYSRKPAPTETGSTSLRGRAGRKEVKKKSQRDKRTRELPAGLAAFTC